MIVEQIRPTAGWYTSFFSTNAMEINMCSLGQLVICSLALTTMKSTAANAASIKATVDLSSQRMHVYVDGQRKYTWVVSTGKKGWRTKTGQYIPFGQRKKFYSSKWRMSLPYLTWIGEDGTAIHGTYQTSKLGRPASHGCIRLSIANAQKFYKLVEQSGFWSTQVEVRQ